MAEAAAGEPAMLGGFRAAWGVAMDNSVAIPGYKRYRDPVDGSVPAVFVAFLDAVQDPAASLPGLLLTVKDGALGALDARERNYERRRLGSGAWIYVGSPEGRARAARGRAEGRLVVQRAYLERVRAGLAAAGAPTADPGCPVVDLVREDLA